jgi:hypothetical protein
LVINAWLKKKEVGSRIFAGKVETLTVNAGSNGAKR